MTDLNRLKVSLTKHNAHKVARLLKDYPVQEVFDHLGDVKAEAAQTRKNLSALPNDALPAVWNKAKALGPDAVDALVLVGIIFSHRDLIRAMAQASRRRGFSGRIERGKQLKGKAYTNFVRIIDQLGYATQHEYAGVSFNLKAMFKISGLGALVAELLQLKLLEAKWDGSNTVSNEASRLQFHEVFGISKKELQSWLTLDAQPKSAAPASTAKDDEFFEVETEGESPKKFKFRPGHNPRDVDPLARSASQKSKVNRLHNDIQNKLYAFLKKKLGQKNVGTELDTGSGTAVDVATQHLGKMTFYEIKTGPSVRASIRQALPQLLEYAFWPQDRRADELVIVSHLPPTKAADRYIAHLRKEFGLPISYRQFDLKSNILR